LRASELLLRALLLRSSELLLLAHHPIAAPLLAQIVRAFALLVVEFVFEV
jgi:hypothetical protein